MNELILSSVFLIFILVREWMHGKEVKLLSEAVIAKNIYEYKDAQTKSQTPEEEKPSKFIAMDGVTDEQFLHSVKKQLNRLTPTDKFKDKIKKVWPIK
jgi:hypothetical protein